MEPMRPRIGVLPLYNTEKQIFWINPLYLMGVEAAGGLPVWANLMLAIADEVEACMQGELKKREARIAKYTAKYKK